jgi:hypothetical protein
MPRAPLRGWSVERPRAVLIPPAGSGPPRRQVLAMMAAGGAAAMAPAASAEEGESASFRRVDKALWIWRTRLADLAGVARFMQRWRFGLAMLSVPPEERARLAADAQALLPLRERDARVMLATGDPNWVRRAAGAPLPRPLLALLDLAVRAGASGIALDVEPHTLEGWKGAERVTLAGGFVTLLAALRPELQSRKLALWIAVHPAHAQVRDPTQTGRSLFEAILSQADGIVTMAYRAKPDAAIAFAGPLLTALQRQNVPWMFGVTTETTETALEIGYGGATAQDFCAAMTALDARLRQTAAASSYRGIAIHHFRPTVALLS